MATYRVGSKGPEVLQIQTRLKTLALYNGPLDGEFGGGTEAAIKAFQKSNKLEIDGQVGAITWKALFNRKIPDPAIVSKPADYKCLALTGAFETGVGIPECFAGISGDFDGQGLSFGVLQWNFGQDSLQPLLKDMIKNNKKIVKSIFQDHYDVLVEALNADKHELMQFARSIQHPVKHFVFEPWRGMFKALGRTEAFQAIEQQYASGLYKSALQLCSDYGLKSERGVALMFDIKVQNGSINKLVQAQIQRDFATLPAGLSNEDAEVEKMKIIANRRAEASNPLWVEDVRARKLCIAKGGGTIHGITYELETQFGISLKNV